MLTRIVRLSFHPENVPAFLDIFHESKSLIEAFDGCNGVELMRDHDLEHVYYTHSKWNSKSDLDNYRHSEVFGGVWKRTKALFNDKPQAFSLVSPT